ncbi:MAG TPA: response regulator [Gaiellaceae bacterium]|jgi:DNA-binding response OmpR family regulator
MREGRTILVVDDEPPLRELIRVSLGDRFAFAEAGDADEAWAEAKLRRPDLVVLDIMLPGRSGLELLRQLKSDTELAHVPVVVLSAWQTDQDARDALDAGADAFFPKPFAPDELARVVDVLLEDAA